MKMMPENNGDSGNGGHNATAMDVMPVRSMSDDPFYVSSVSKPRVNVIDTPDAVKFEMAAPGMNKDAFCINPEGNTLVIEYEQEEDTRSALPVNKCRLGGYNYLSFRRILPIPDQVDRSKIGTHYINGVLNVVLPKKKEVYVNAI